MIIVNTLKTAYNYDAYFCLGTPACTGALGGKQDVIVHSDHQPLGAIFKKRLSSAPRRL